MKTKSKPCRLCGTVKPFTDFYKEPGGKNGIKTECKKCAIERNANYRFKNRMRVSDQWI